MSPACVAGSIATSPMESHGESPSKSKKISISLADLDTAPPSSTSEEGDQALVVPALLASFPHGFPRAVESLDVKATVTETRAVKRPRAVLEAETQHMRYHSSQPLNNKKTLAKYVVGVYSKSSQEVVLYPVESVLQVSQTIKAVERASSEAQDKEAPRQDNYEKRKSLVQDFGSKKKQRSMQSKEDNRIRADGVMGMNALGSFLATNVQSAIKDAEQAGDAFSAAEASRSQLLPPFHRSAKVPAKVYRLREIITENEWPCLEEEADWMLDTHKSGTEVDASVQSIAEQYKVWPSFVASALRDCLVNATIEAKERRERLCAIAYLRHLFSFYQAPPVMHGEPSQLSDILHLPEAVTMRLLSTFAEKNSGGEKGDKYMRTKAMGDKLLLYLLVLCLIVGNFKVSATRIAQDLRMGVKDVGLLFRETGCSTNKRFRGQSERGSSGGGGRMSQEEVMAELTVPLRFPAPGKRMSARN